MRGLRRFGNASAGRQKKGEQRATRSRPPPVYFLRPIIAATAPITPSATTATMIVLVSSPPVTRGATVPTRCAPPSVVLPPPPTWPASVPLATSRAWVRGRIPTLSDGRDHGCAYVARKIGGPASHLAPSDPEGDARPGHRGALRVGHLGDRGRELSRLDGGGNHDQAGGEGTELGHVEHLVRPEVV